MPSLAELQAAMRAYVLDEPGSPSILPVWCLGDEAMAAARLATYQSTCNGTLVNALRLSYPAVRRVLGAEYFDAVAAQFVRREPPTSACLNDYGARFAQFAAGQPATGSLFYLEDLARLDWAVNTALHAPAVPGLLPERLMAMEPDMLARVCFRAHPGVSVLSVRYAVERIWKAVLENDERDMRQISLASGEGWLLVERDAQLAVQVRRLPETVGRLSARLLAGDPLHCVLETIVKDGPDGGASEPTLPQRVLADHLVAGRFVDFWVREPPQEECAS